MNEEEKRAFGLSRLWLAGFMEISGELRSSNDTSTPSSKSSSLYPSSHSFRPVVRSLLHAPTAFPTSQRFDWEDLLMQEQL